MLKKLLFQVFIGGATLLFGAFLHSVTEERDLGTFFAITGVIYAVVASLLTLIGVNLPSPFNDEAEVGLIHKVKKNTVSKKARVELLDYKKLLDAGAITQEEFDKKSTELKKLFL